MWVRPGAGIRIEGVVQDLVFEADDVILALAGRSWRRSVSEKFTWSSNRRFPSVAQEDVILDAILQAAVASARDSPIEGQFEISESLLRKKIFGDLRVWRMRFQAAVFECPGIARGSFLPRIVPAAHILSIEEQLPSGGLLGGRELVFLRG